ncbi:hypothetical protein [Glycomyces tenuis]|uniref:hypothetical protein n=1 Tax=Glycomyces tenuis TaxID=58116 RepID=UPI00138E22B1|nr:hypothetical protein [Glycomyces tenuis]
MASMAGLWAVVLLGGAWIAPGFASGGGEEETDPRDQPATDEVNAASRYLRFGSDGDTERAEEVLCDDADPEVTAGELVELRASYEEELGSYPETEVSTDLPTITAEGVDIGATVSYIAGNSFREEQFTISVRAEGDNYCVSQVVRHESEEEEDETGAAVDPQELAAKYLSAIFVIRDLEAASDYQCAEYEGPGPEELDGALAEWETLFGEATAIQSFDGDPAPSGTQTGVPMSVELSATQATESFSFEVTVEGDCVSALAGGEALLDPSAD